MYLRFTCDIFFQETCRSGYMHCSSCKVISIKSPCTNSINLPMKSTVKAASMSKYSVRSYFRFKDCTSRSTLSWLVLTDALFMTSALQKDISGNATLDLGSNKYGLHKAPCIIKASKNKVSSQSLLIERKNIRHIAHFSAFLDKFENLILSHLRLCSFQTCFRM